MIADDGRSINGIVPEETAAALVLKTPDGPGTVPKDSIDERTTSPVSMMPSRLLENLPEADLLALLEFLITKPSTSALYPRSGIRDRLCCRTRGPGKHLSPGKLAACGSPAGNGSL